MIPSSYYYLIYIVFVTLLSIVTLSRYSSYSSARLEYPSQSKYDVSLLIVIILTFFIGFRDPFAVAFQDTQAYSRWYTSVFGDMFVWDWTLKDPLFTNTMLWMSSLRIPIEFYYSFIAFLYFGGVWLCCKKMFSNDTLSAFVVYLAAFSTYSYGVNGLRSGVAAAFFLIAIAMREKKRYMWVAICILLSIGVHHSMLMPVIAFLLCCFYKNPKLYMAFWLFCFVMAVLHISYFQQLFVSFGEGIDDDVVGYLGADSSGYVKTNSLGGFRIDFVLYSFIPMLIGWISVLKKKIKSENYIFLLNLYTFVNAIWLLCMYAVFTNRIAYLSWLMYPIVLVYPFLKEKWGVGQYKVFKWIAYGHLGFTLFMMFIYY